MNFFDIVFALVFAVLTILGLKRGFLRETLSALGFVLGYLAAVKYHQTFFFHLLAYIDNQTYAKVITFVVIFLFGAAIGMTLSSLAHLIFNSGSPTFASRVVGGGLGFVKGTFLSLVVILIVRNLLSDSFGDDLNRSFFLPRLLELKDAIVRLMAI